MQENTHDDKGLPINQLRLASVMTYFRKKNRSQMAVTSPANYNIPVTRIAVGDYVTMSRAIAVRMTKMQDQTTGSSTVIQTT